MYFLSYMCRFALFFFKGKCQEDNHLGQRFPVPVFSIPIPVWRLSSLGTRFQFQDCPCLEHDSEPGSDF